MHDILNQDHYIYRGYFFTPHSIININECNNFSFASIIKSATSLQPTICRWISADIIDNKRTWQRYNCNPLCIRLDIASQITISVCQSCLYFLWENEQEGNMSRRTTQCTRQNIYIFEMKSYFNKNCHHYWSWWKIELFIPFS